MAYAAPADMIARFGQAELLRLTVPEGQPLDTIDQTRVTTALADASAEIDSYARRRYLTPVSPAPQELVRACCVLARYELATGNGLAPTEQMVKTRAEVVTWLERLRDGRVFLADATPAGEESFAQAQTRGPVYGAGVGGGWPGPGEFWQA